MAYTQVGIHHPDPDEVHVTTYEVEGMSRRSIQLSKGGAVMVYGDPAELVTFFETIVVKLKEGLEPEAATPAEPHAVLSQEDVDLVVEADGILAHEAGDGRVMVAGRIVREIDGSLSTDEATPPPSVRFELPEGVQRTEPFADIDRTTEPDLIADRREDEDGERI